MEKKQKLTVEQIADIALYGTEWYKGDEESYSYNLGALETTAHVLACMVYQNHLLEAGYGVLTADMVDLIRDFPSKAVLVKRINKYIKESAVSL